MIKSWLNGEEACFLPLEDRGFLYGDGFFTTISLGKGKPFLLDLHFQRLQSSAELLFIELDLIQLEQDLKGFLSDCPKEGFFTLKIIVTRGEGQRGYSPKGANTSNVVFQLFEYKNQEALARKRLNGLTVGLANTPLSSNKLLAGIKHLSCLSQVLVANEFADSDCDEALVFDEAGNLIESLSANVYLLNEDKLRTPILNTSGVEGVMKAYLKNQLTSSNYLFVEEKLKLEDVLEAEAIFLSNCIMGLCPVAKINARDWAANNESLSKFLGQVDLSQACF